MREYFCVSIWTRTSRDVGTRCVNCIKLHEMAWVVWDHLRSLEWLEFWWIGKVAWAVWVEMSCRNCLSCTCCVSCSHKSALILQQHLVIWSSWHPLTMSSCDLVFLSSCDLVILSSLTRSTNLSVHCCTPAAPAEGRIQLVSRCPELNPINWVSR